MPLKSDREGERCVLEESHSPRAMGDGEVFSWELLLPTPGSKLQAARKQVDTLNYGALVARLPPAIPSGASRHCNFPDFR